MKSAFRKENQLNKFLNDKGYENDLNRTHMRRQRKYTVTILMCNLITLSKKLQLFFLKIPLKT